MSVSHIIFNSCFLTPGGKIQFNSFSGRKINEHFSLTHSQLFQIKPVRLKSRMDSEQLSAHYSSPNRAVKVSECTGLVPLSFISY